MMAEVTLIFASYALGCFTTGYYLVRWRTGRDIRTLGSGNAGARNVGRSLGYPGFAVTFLADFAKGWIAAAAAVELGFGLTVQICALLAVVAGHNWPAQLGFRGGKGIATSLGAILAWDPEIGMMLALVAVPLMVLLRSFSLGGLFAFGVSPLILRFYQFSDPEVVAMSLLGIIVLVAHRGNIRSEIARLTRQHNAEKQPATGRFHQ